MIPSRLLLHKENRTAHNVQVYCRLRTSTMTNKTSLHTTRQINLNFYPQLKTRSQTTKISYKPRKMHGISFLLKYVTLSHRFSSSLIQIKYPLRAPLYSNGHYLTRISRSISDTLSLHSLEHTEGVNTMVWTWVHQ